MVRVGPGSRSFLARPFGLPLHMLTVITLEPINSCPVALLLPKGSPDPSPTSARSGIVANALNLNPNLVAAILLSLRRSLAETRSMDVETDQTFFLRHLRA